MFYFIDFYQCGGLKELVDTSVWYFMLSLIKSHHTNAFYGVWFSVFNYRTISNFKCNCSISPEMSIYFICLCGCMCIHKTLQNYKVLSSLYIVASNKLHLTCSCYYKTIFPYQELTPAETTDVLGDILSIKTLRLEWKSAEWGSLGGSVG